MLIREANGETWDDEATYTAWDLVGNQAWIDRGYYAQIKGGRVKWETADNFGGRLVRLQRLVPMPGGRLAQPTRYVDPDTPMVLVKGPNTDTEDKYIAYDDE